MALVRITRADDARLAPYRALPAHDAKRRGDCFVAETREVVRQLVREAGFRLRSVLLSESALGAMESCLRERPDVPVYVAPLAVLKSIVGFDFHRGCLALGERGRERSLEELLAAAPRRLVLLEDVSNPDNVGGVLRVARALGVDAAVLSQGCSDPLYRKAVRVSLGAALTLPWARVASWATTLEAVRAAGVTLIALTPGGETDIAALDCLGSRRIALVVGAEGEGLRAATIGAADLAVRIPMAAGIDSLNLVTACAVALDRLGGARRPAGRS